MNWIVDQPFRFAMNVFFLIRPSWTVPFGENYGSRLIKKKLKRKIKKLLKKSLENVLVAGEFSKNEARNGKIRPEKLFRIRHIQSLRNKVWHIMRLWKCDSKFGSERNKCRIKLKSALESEFYLKNELFAEFKNPKISNKLRSIMWINCVCIDNEIRAVSYLFGQYQYH